ncbi:MAG: TRAP transporter large permease subunit [Marinovum algicola]|jgi:tripartite ATP-independent transporter DctM subunit|uniref:TRAP transporter large permease protein n=1 Tax=Marinovum algicola TaxID=42444 RepID=A0A975ZPV8_9RHOB|nr:TRAP transporter large permease subunit [Marinovum algicola]SEJ96236.1 TRAP transporter, DctM subunit [Marinovum algicola]SLN69166.1 Sialic acid TRAP transporter permease protein SiaT [Marinovum algicola]
MSIALVTALIVIALLALMVLGTPLGVATLLVSVATSLIYFGLPGLFLVSSNVYHVLENYSLVAVPLFVFMAGILERSGIAESLFDAMAELGGSFPGSLGIQTCVVAVFLAAMSGIMGGEIVMLGMIALPQMFRLGYDRKLSIGIICASGALATLIPPSIVMIVYGVTANVSISDLFLGGTGPGLLLASIYMLYIYSRARMNPALAPALPAKEGPSGPRKRAAIKALIAPLFVITSVMGTIYSGIASVTEAAAIGACAALLVALLRRRLSYGMIRDTFRQTVLTVGSVVWLVLGAVSLVGIYNIIGGSRFLQGVLEGLDWHPLLVVLLMMAIVFVLGTFMEWIAIVFITVPIFAPVVVGFGYDPIWFGVLFAMNIQIYYLSPPFGPACFFLKSVAPREVTLQEIFASVWPFVLMQIAGLLLVLFFPQIALFLPEVLAK